MVKPTLAEIRVYQNTGKMPESLKKRQDKSQKAPKKQADTTTKENEPVKTEQHEVVQSEWPKQSGGGWWQLSSGKKIQNEETARLEQSKIDT